MVKAVEQDQLTLFMLHGFETTLTDIFMTVAENPALLYEIDMPESVVSPFFTQKAALVYAVNLKKRLLEASGGVGFGVDPLEPQLVADLKDNAVEIVLPPRTRKMALSEFPHLRNYAEQLTRELLRAVTQTVAAITTSKYLAELRHTVVLERELEREELKQRRMLVNAVDELVVFKERIRVLEEEIRLKDFHESHNKQVNRTKNKRPQVSTPTAVSALQEEDDRDTLLGHVDAPPVSALAPRTPVGTSLNDRDYLDQQTDRLVDKLVTSRLLTILAGKEEFKVANQQIEDLTAAVAELTAEKAALRVKFEAKFREGEQKDKTIGKLNIELTYKAKELEELRFRLEQLQDALDSLNDKYTILLQTPAPAPAFQAGGLAQRQMAEGVLMSSHVQERLPQRLLEIYQPDIPAIRQLPSIRQVPRIQSGDKETLPSTKTADVSPVRVDAAELDGVPATEATGAPVTDAIHRSDDRFLLDMISTEAAVIRPVVEVAPAPFIQPNVTQTASSSKSAKTTKGATKRLPLQSRSARLSPPTQAEPEVVDRGIQTTEAKTRELVQRPSLYSSDAEDTQLHSTVAVALSSSRTVETQTDFRVPLSAVPSVLAPASSQASLTAARPGVEAVEGRLQQQRRSSHQGTLPPLQPRSEEKKNGTVSKDMSDSFLSPGALMQEAMEQLLLVAGDADQQHQPQPQPQYLRPEDLPPYASHSQPHQQSQLPQYVLPQQQQPSVQTHNQPKGEKLSYAALAERTDLAQLGRVFDRLYADAVDRLERVKTLVEDSDTGKQTKLEKIFSVFRVVTSLANVASDGMCPVDFRVFFSHYVESTPHQPITNFWLSNNFFARRKRWPKRYQETSSVALPNITVSNVFVSHLPQRRDQHSHTYSP